MDFGKSKRSFEEVDYRYAQLKDQVDAGQITQEKFDEQLKRSMVQDDSGRWWAKSRKGGEWHYHDGRTWVRGTPPGYAPPGYAPPTLEQPSTEQRRDTLIERPSTYEDRRPTEHNQNEGEKHRREPSSSLGRIVVLSLIAVVFVLGIGGALFLNSTESTSSKDNSFSSAIPTPKTTTIVPDLGGKTLSDAAQTVGTDYVLEVKGVRGTDDNNNQPKGTIVTQEPDPSEGEPAPIGTVIDLYLSGGQEEVMAPDVSSLSVLEASKILLEAGLFPATDPNGSLGARDIQVVKLDQRATPVAVIDRGSGDGEEKDVSHLTVTSATLSDSTPAAGSKANPGDLIFLAY